MWIEIAPWLVAMLVLVAFSGFFSASEAALFSLRQRDRRRLERGNRSQRAAAVLLDDPDRLLSAVLFWNLVVNIAYFAIASIIGFRFEDNDAYGAPVAYGFAIGSLLTLIFCSEMLPKSVAVLNPVRFAGLIGVPLSMAVRAIDRIMPVLRTANLLSQRLVWPRLQPEPYLEVSDLESAIELSTTNAHIAEQEQLVLSNIVAMSDIRVDEWMRPRANFVAFRPPVSLDDLHGEMTPSGYLLVTDPNGDEVVAAIDLQNITQLPTDHLERHAQPVLYVPWCATVADAFERMRASDRDVVIVVSEYGESIGMLTFQDILDTLFTRETSRRSRLMNRMPIQAVGEDRWRISGGTSLRRLARKLQMPLPASRSVTVGGAIQELLQRWPSAGDQGQWGPFQFHVIQADDRGNVMVELTLQPPDAAEDLA